MAVERPSLETVIMRHIDDIDSTNPDLGVKIAQSPLNVLARTNAGLIHGIYGYAAFLFLMSLPTKALGAYLNRWGELLGMPRNPASKARPVARFVTSIPGTASKGDTVRRSDGFIYEVLADTALASPYTDVTLIAAQAGVAGSVTSGISLTITPALEGVDTATVVQADADGEDLEKDEPYRTRILARLQRPPQGGSADDYVAWARSVSGVGDAWVIDSEPPFVDVRIVTTDVNDLEAGAQLIQDVQDKVDAKRPVNAKPIVDTAAVFAQAVTITDLVPDTADLRSAIEASLAFFYLLRAIRTPNSTTYETALSAAIQNTPGVTTFTLVSPTGNNNYGDAGFPVFDGLVVT